MIPHVDNQSPLARAELADWRTKRLPVNRAIQAFVPGPDSVTVIAYHFRPEDSFDASFDAVECAILETWRHCGIMRTSLVVNMTPPSLKAFAERHSPWVRIFENQNLVPGRIQSMSIDCNANLHRYFETSYALIVQNDGFPLQSGLEEFLGRWDYVGAPMVRSTPLTRFTRMDAHLAVGNGGFSLRSHHICELASYYWTRTYSHLLPDTSRFVNEDAFYCCTLPLLHRAYRKSVRFATKDEAQAFSYDAVCQPAPAAKPFGFHGPGAFYLFRKAGMIADAELDA